MPSSCSSAIRTVFSIRTLNQLLLAIALLLAPSVVLAQATFVSTEITAVGSGLVAPAGVAADGLGDLFIADTGNNRVLIVAATGANAGVPTTLVSGLSRPNGVASDWAGNVYIADTGNNRIVILPMTEKGYGTQITLSPGLNSPMSVAVDGSHNLFIADAGNNRGLMLPYMAGSYGAPSVVTSALAHPEGVAVDTRGYVYFADTGNNRIVQLIPTSAGYSKQTTVRGATAPAAVAVDQSYDLFFADTGNNRVIEVPWSSGAKRFNNPITLTSDLSGPTGVAIDFTGNVYVADTANNRTQQILPETVDFAAYQVNSKGVPQSYNFQIAAGTTIGSVGILTQGLPAKDFTDAGFSTCTAQTYAAVTLCGVSVGFKPLKSGIRMGAIVLYDNAGTQLTTAFISGTGNAPQAIYVPGMQTVISSNLSGPAGVAVDASGNVLIADTGNNRVVELPSAAGVYGAMVTLPVSNLQSPLGLGFDGAGSMFIASNDNDTVLKLLSNNGVYGSQKKVGQALYGPWAVSVDKNGYVYIADTLANNLKALPWNGSGYGSEYSVGNYHRFPESVAVDGMGNVYFATPYWTYIIKVPRAGDHYETQKQVQINGLVSPTGLVTDPNGNVYVLDGGTGTIVMLPANGSGFGAPLTVAQGFNSPSAIAIDGNGDLYVADTGNNQVVKVTISSPPALQFADTYLGTSASSNQVVNVVNVGNQPLAFSAVSYPTDFPEHQAAVNPCTSSTSQAGGVACQLAIDFTPLTIADPLAELVGFTTNSLGASGVALTIPVSGNSYGKLSQTITFSPLANTTYATVSLPLLAISTAGLPVSFVVTSGPGSINTKNNMLSINGAGVIVIQATQAGNTSYNAATSVSQALIVTPAPLFVTPANLTSVYGAAPTSYRYTLAGFVRNDTAAWAVSGTPEVTSVASNRSGAGTYAITVSAGSFVAANYQIVPVAATLTISKAILSVLPVAASSVYGSPLPAFTYTVSGFLNGDTAASAITGKPAYTTAATTTSTPGTYAVTMAAGTTVSSNYTLSFGGSTLTVGKAALTVTPTPMNMTYGSAVPVIHYVVTGFVGSDNASVITGTPAFHTTATSSAPVGTYPVTVTQGHFAANCYTFVGLNGSITIQKATASVIVNNATMTFGAPVPALTYRISGLVNGDTQARAISGQPLLTTGLSRAAIVGTYATKPAAGAMTAQNYNLKFVPGTLTVAKAPLTITAASLSMKQGATLPTLTDAVTGLVNGDTIATATVGAPTISTIATAKSAVGSYSIDLALGKLTARNYTIKLVSGTMTIRK